MKKSIIPSIYFEVAKTDGKGRGIIARVDIDSHVVVESSPCLLLTAADVTELRKLSVIRGYLFTLDNQKHKYGLVFGYGSLFNHSLEPNLEIVYSNTDVLHFRTIRRVKQGQELTIDYGFENLLSTDFSYQ